MLKYFKQHFGFRLFRTRAVLLYLIYTCDQPLKKTKQNNANTRNTGH